MSDEPRKKALSQEEEGADEARMGREESLLGDDQLYTPQGGGGGTGGGAIQEVAAVRKGPESGLAEDQPQDVVHPGMSLPQVAGGVSESQVAAVPGTPGTGESGQEENGPSSFRLLSTLTVAGAIAGALLVFVFLWSEPLIQAENARVLQEAVTEVLKSPDHFQSVFLLDGELTAQVPEGVDTLDLDKVFLGFDAEGNPIGFALEAAGFGFQDIIHLIFGYDPGEGEVIGMKVLRHAETPGLGDRIVRDLGFVGGFDGVEAPIEGVKPNQNTGDPHQVDMITGVTISSKAVIRIINERIAAMGDLMAAYDAGGSPATGADDGGEEDGR